VSWSAGTHYAAAVEYLERIRRALKRARSIRGIDLNKEPSAMRITGVAFTAVAAAVALAVSAAPSSARTRIVPTAATATTGNTYGAPAPSGLDVPAGNRPIAVLDAKGVQTYTCTSAVWKFLEPAATLWEHGDLSRRAVALHSRGPVWVSTRDGSAVNAAAVASVTGRSNAIPELLLKATATRGDGTFGNVSYVQRLNTTGGLAPTQSCTEGSQIGIPYTATYVFYAPSH
jgi:hypothetical protein